MGTKMKGIYKGFKYTLTHMFDVKEREMEIGTPTDVKHVAHIGWDGPSGNAAPSWMNEFRTGPDFASTSIGRSGRSPWSSQANNQDQHPPESKDGDVVKKKKKKEKRKKIRSSSSTKSTGSSSSFSMRSSRGAKSKAKYTD
ncbi:hypothetical protein M569_07120, partial [Genlisea aurea]